MEVAVFFFCLVLCIWFLITLKNEEGRLDAHAKLKDELADKLNSETVTYAEYERLHKHDFYPIPEQEMRRRYAEYVARRELKEFEAAEVKRLAQEEEIIRKIPQINTITSAEIAQITIKSFDATKILAVADFLTGPDIQEAIESLHETLRPIYEEALVTHYRNNLGIADVETVHIQPQIKRCMEQGFNAILKLEELQGLWSKTSDLGSSKQVKKKRTWKEIFGERS
jgi:hypothetical protein